MFWNTGQDAAMVAFLRDAARLARMVRDELAPASLTKEDRSPVTVADFSVQALAGLRLGAAYPGVPVVGEENSAPLKGPGGAESLKQVVEYVRRFEERASARRVCEWIDRGGAAPGGRFWVLDPVDGTKGFLRGGQYAVSLGLVEDGVVTVGGLACPALGLDGEPGNGVLTVARRGKGAFIIPLDAPEFCRPIRVSPCADPRRAVLLRSFESGHTNVDRIEALIRHLGMKNPPVPMDSQAKYAMVAAGYGEIILRMPSPDAPDYREKIWDHAGGVVVLEEAGGRVTDIEGNPYDFTRGRRLEANTGLLASNGAVHDALLEAIRRTA